MTASAQQTTNWTGFYIGVHDGGGWGWAGWDAASVSGNPASTGFPTVGLTQGIFGGGQIGFTVQHGPLLFGAEATLSATNIDGQIECGDGATFGYICNTRLNALATLTGQIGFALDRTRVYIAGGGAWARHAQEITEPFFAYLTTCPTCYSWGATTESSWGWTAGFGFERALSHGLSFRADYRYVGFPTRSDTLTSPIWPDSNVTLAQRYHLVSFGLNYRFGHGGEPSMASLAEDDGWEREFGQRAWLTFSNYRFDLYATTFDPLDRVSRLTYGTSIGGTGEGFYRAASPAGFYFAGLIGAGVSGGGLLVDEDFPPITFPYSRTESDLSGGRFSYAVVDLGWEFDRPLGSVGVFVGAAGMLERYQSYGCDQTALHPGVCVPAVPAEYDIITQTTGWAGLRVGLAVDLDVTEKISVRGEGAYLPLVYMAGCDNHWLRPDINPFYSYGRGTGFQLEGAVEFAVSEQLTAALGARYWQVMAAGGAAFPPYVGAQPQETFSRHYGAFFELTYGIGE